MQAGCYTLDLYCDVEGCTYNARKGIYGPDQFFSEFGSVCRRKAREAGWKLATKKDPRDLCPEHAKEKR